MVQFAAVSCVPALVPPYCGHGLPRFGYGHGPARVRCCPSFARLEEHSLDVFNLVVAYPEKPRPELWARQIPSEGISHEVAVQFSAAAAHRSRTHTRA